MSVRDGIHWTSGGGFSNHTAVQWWQSDVVNDFVQQASADNTFPPTQYFNASGRAYPDVVTLGHNVLIRWGARFACLNFLGLWVVVWCLRTRPVDTRAGLFTLLSVSVFSNCLVLCLSICLVVCLSVCVCRGCSWAVLRC